MNKEYYDIVKEISKNTVKQNNRDNIIKYFKNNIFGIMDLLIALAALIISIMK